MSTQIHLGLINPKSPSNMGSILRAAGCYQADAIYYTGRRYDQAMKFSTDTKTSANHIPCTNCSDLREVIPSGSEVVLVDLIEGATPLPHFQHPQQAFYIFGPEDGSIDKHLIDVADHAVYVPTTGCMNLAASVNVLLYDRLAKSDPSNWHDGLIKASRDTNNRLRWPGHDR